MAGTESYVTATDGVRLFVRQLGTGSTTVVIPNATYMFDDFKHLAGDYNLISYDLRNRGRSDDLTGVSRPREGVLDDVEDLEAIRAHFGIRSVNLIGHSYVGMVVALYAMKYPANVNRVIQIGPAQPVAGKEYPPHLKGADATMAEVSSKIAELQSRSASGDSVEFGKKLWLLMRLLYVTNPADADKINWSVADLPNEALPKVMQYFNDTLLPSFQKLRLAPRDLARMKMPVLVIHGTRDRHAPYGGGRDWAAMLPDARLVTVENAAHLPWIENPDQVFSSIRTFLDGNWPDAAEHGS